MATFQDGNRRRATANTVTSMRNSASKRQCPKCGRKSAIKFHSDQWTWGSYCRWEDCGYQDMKVQEYLLAPEDEG